MFITQFLGKHCSSKLMLKLKSIFMLSALLIATYPVSIVNAYQDPAISSCYVSPPLSVKPGDTIYLRYNISNPNSQPINAWLGASVRNMVTGREYNDENHDKVVTLYPGNYYYTRIFTIPSEAELGIYEVIFGLHGGNVVGEGSYLSSKYSTDILRVTISVPSISVYNYPFEPTEEDGVYLHAKIVSSVSLSSVKAFWSTDKNNWNEMNTHLWFDGANYDEYVTDSKIPAQPAESTVYYKVSATNRAGTATSSIEQYNVEPTIARIHGRVTDDYGNGIYGATVTLESAVNGIQTTTSDNTAVFTFFNVKEGTYTLKAHKDGYSSYSKPVTIKTGPHEIAVQITNSQPTNLIVTALSPYSVFSAQQYRPITVKAKVTDNLENIVVGNSGSLVKATFSNGDSELVLLDDGLHNDEAANDGIYANQWAPSGISEGYDETDCTITIEASSGILSSNPITVSGVIRNGTVVDVVHSYMETRTFKSVLTTDTDVLNSPAWNSYIENILTDAGIDRSAYYSASLDRSSSRYYIKRNNNVYVPISITINSDVPPVRVLSFVNTTDNTLVTNGSEFIQLKNLENLAIFAGIDSLNPEQHDLLSELFSEDALKAKDNANFQSNFGFGFTTLKVSSDIVPMLVTGGAAAASGSTVTRGISLSSILNKISVVSDIATAAEDLGLLSESLAVESHNYELYTEVKSIESSEIYQYILKVGGAAGFVGDCDTVAKDYYALITLRNIGAVYGPDYLQLVLNEAYLNDPAAIAKAAKSAHDELYNMEGIAEIINTLLGTFSPDKADQSRVCYLNSIDYAMIYSYDNQIASYQLKVKDGSIKEKELIGYCEYQKERDLLYADIYMSSADQAEKNLWGEIWNYRYPKVVTWGADYVGFFLTGDTTQEAISNLRSAGHEHLISAARLNDATFGNWYTYYCFEQFDGWFNNIETADFVSPHANAGDDFSVNTGETIYFDGSSSTDNIGIISYSWDFDASNGIQEDATGIFPSHIYNEPGAYTVTLTVNDGKNNGPVSDTLTVYVEPEDFSVEILPKNASFSIEASSTFNQQFNVKNVGTVADTFRISAERGTLSAEEITLNPGEVNTFTLEDTIMFGGIYPVSVAIWPKSDPSKAAVSKLTIDVLSHNPYTPSIPSGPITGSSMEVYAYSTVSKDPDGTNIKYIFDWGDGLTTETPFYPSGVSVSLGHQWLNEGIFYVKVKAIDSTGKESSWSNGKSVFITTHLYDSSKPVEYWEKTFGVSDNDKINYVIETADGGYLLVGSTRSFGSGQSDGWIIKTDMDGNEAWDKTFGGVLDDEFNEVIQTSDKGYVLTGSTKSFGAGLYDVWLVKLDSNGAEQWNETYGGLNDDIGRSIIETPDGKFIIAGGSDSYGSGNSCGWIIKTTSIGDKLWSREYGSSNYDAFECIQPAIDGGYILVGQTEKNSADVWMVKVDSSGLWQWDNTFGGNWYDQAHSVKQAPDGGYIIAAEYDDSDSSGNTQAWVIKTDENGDKVWDFKSFWENENSFARDILLAPDGDYLMLGDKSDGGFLSKIDSSGQIKWSQKLGSGSRLQSIVLNSNSEYILAGHTEEDGFLLKAGPSFPIIPYIESPKEGITYTENPVKIKGDVFKTYGDVDLWYELDNGPAVNLASPEFDTVLPSLSNGEHTLIVYAKDTADKIYSKEVVFNFKSASGWFNTYGGPQAETISSCLQTSDSGFLLVGSSTSFGSGGWILKTNLSGYEEWNRTFEEVATVYSGQQTTEGGYILTGTGTNNGHDAFCLIKTDASGNQEWNRTYGEFANARSVEQTSDGGYIIGGYNAYPSRSDYDLYLVKTNSAGAVEWSRSYGTAGDGKDEYGYCVHQTIDGGYVLVGQAYNEDRYGSDICVLKTDSSGNQVSFSLYRRFDFKTTDSGRYLIETDDGDLIVAGYTEGLTHIPEVGPGPTGEFDAFLLKISPSGGWFKTYGGADDDIAYHVSQTTEGGYVLTGCTESYGEGGTDVYVVKTDESGNLEWAKTKGGLSNDCGWFIHEIDDGYFGIAGVTESFGTGSSDAFLIKEDLDYPRINFTSPIKGATYTGDNILLSFTINEMSDVWYNLDEGTNTTQNNNITAFQANLGFLGDGSHSLKIYAKDKVGNLAIYELDFTVDHLPQIHINSPVEGEKYNSNNISVSISSSETGKLRYVLDDNTISKNVSGKSVDLILFNLTKGNHNVMAFFEDESGGTVSSKVNFSVTSDGPANMQQVSSPLIVIGVEDGAIIETPRVKYNLANGGFAKELWVDHNSDGTYDENLAYNDQEVQNKAFGFGSWMSTYKVGQGSEVYEGSVSNGNYSWKLKGISQEKASIEFTNEFDYVTAKTQWDILTNGDAKVIPWTLDSMENTYALGFCWWVYSQHQGDLVGMRLSEDTEATLGVTYTTDRFRQIASPGPVGSREDRIRSYADFSDMSYSYPYQFYQDRTHDYTCMVVEPKVTTEDDWEWIETDQANDAIWGGRLNMDPTVSDGYQYKAAGLVDWVWYSDPALEAGGYGGEYIDSPTTQPINQDNKFSFYVHWMWGDTTEQSRHETAGQISQILASEKPWLDDSPIAHAGSDKVATTGLTVIFNGSASTDDKGIASYSWDFDDLDGITSEAIGMTTNHTYTNAGNYTVTLTVTDTIGQRSSDTLEVVVINPVDNPPVAKFSSNVTEGYVPLSVQFMDLAENATSWEWNFGDGTSLSGEQNPLHVYMKEGNYTVSLNASSPAGYNTVTEIDYIIVADWNPWNDMDSDGGQAITLSELQDAIYDWRFGIQTSTGEMVDLSRLQDLIYCWRFGS